MSLVKQKMVKAKMQTATLARHSCMKTSSDEQKAREKRRQAQDNPARGDGSRTVTAGELLSKMSFMYRSSRDTFTETLAVPTLYQHFARRHFSADEGDRRRLMRM